MAPKSDIIDNALRIVESVVDDEEQARKLLEYKGEDAQMWLDALQLLTDLPEVETKLRSSMYKIMLHLSKRSGLCPRTLMIENVTRLGDNPVDWGGFGLVWKGRIGISKKVVCLKVVKIYTEASDVQRVRLLAAYMQEAIVWQQLKHPNVLPFIGMYYLNNTQEQLCLISPWMDDGNLSQFVKKNNHIDHYSLAYDVAAGLHYLHSKKIVHGDLKAVNVLITPDERACIGDFGLSRIADTQAIRLTSSTTSVKGSERWLSPELLMPDPSCAPSTSSDIYAYGCVCYEIFTQGNVPFHELRDAAVVLAVVINKRHPLRPEQPVTPLTDEMWNIMVSCWNFKPRERPTAPGLVERLLSFNSSKTGKPIAPALDWNVSKLTELRKNIKHSAVDTMVLMKLQRSLCPSSAQEHGSATFTRRSGLDKGADVLRELIALCEEVSANRNVTRQLGDQCQRLLLAVEKYQPQDPDMLQYAFEDVTQCITGVKARVEKWAKLTWPRALVQLNEIQAAIDVSKAEIAECFLRFQLASAADTSRWQTEFTDVARLDHEETIAYLSSIQDGQEIMKELMSNYGDKMLLEQEKTTNELKKVMAFMQENMGGLQSSSTDKYVAISKNLHNIQASTKTLLPNLHLVSGEITDIEVHPVSSTITADVFRGCYLHRETVAIKVLRSVKPDEKTKQRFSREVRIWECIYNIDRGKYILPFYGFGEGSDSRPFMVSPWQENGNALSYVRENDEKVNYKEMITGIAEGLKVLHSLMKPPIVHGDIRAENIFINSEGNPLLSDFGLSKMTEEMTNIPFTQSAGVADLYRWFAPEIHIGSGSVSLSSDIYSFGMTVLELFTHQYPFSKIKHPSEVVLVVARGRKPPQPKEARVVERGLDDDMWRLLIECWDHIPSARPDIEEVLERLSDWDYFHDCQVTLLR